MDMEKNLEKRNRGKKNLLFLLLLFLVSGFLLQNGAKPVYASSNSSAVSAAKRNKLTKGKWVQNKQGIRYQKSNKKYQKSGWAMIADGIYYFDADGYVKRGAFTLNGGNYFADPKGKILVRQWRKKGKNYYYYDGNGRMVKSDWYRIQGKKYYFTRTGELVTNSWIGNSYVNKTGACVTNTTVSGRKIDKKGDIKNISSKDKYIIVGASRIVDMSVAVNSSNTVFIAKSGQGYHWLVSSAFPILKKYLKQEPGCKVIFQLGNNDLENLRMYIEFYQKLIRKYPSTEFYFSDATPGNGEKDVAKNPRRQYFNSMMEAAFGERCIGGYDFMFSIGFKTVDGTHYTASVSRQLYNNICQKVKQLHITGATAGGSKTVPDMVQ